MRKADVRLILRRRILACDDHAVEGCSEASAAASWSDDVSRPALERAHEQDYNVHDEAKRGRRFGRRQALHLFLFFVCVCKLSAVVHSFAVRCISLASTGFLFSLVPGIVSALAALPQRLRFIH